MKCRAVALAGLLGLLASAQTRGAEVKVRWQPVERDTDGQAIEIHHYVVHHGTVPRPTGVHHPSDGTFHYEVQTSTGTEPGLSLGPLTENRVYYFAVTAVDRLGIESDYSLEVHLAIGDPPAVVPTGSPPSPTAAVDTHESGCGCALGAPSPGGSLLLGLWWLRRRRRSRGSSIGRRDQ